jgi:ribosome-associated protein
VDSVAVLPKRRKATKPTKSSQRKRLDTKATRGDVKKLRGRVSGGE